MAFFGGASVDLASPPAIGNTTPNTGAFTFLKTTGGQNATNGISFTGSGGNSGKIAYVNYGAQVFFGENTTSGAQCMVGNTFRVRNDGQFSWSNSNSNADTTGDLLLRRDAAGVLAQYNGTNAQTFRLYNTFTDVSNYERGFMRWATNVLEIGAEAAGTGTQRQLRFPLGTVTASTPLSITQTWNASGTTFTGLLLNATDTASAAGSLLMNLQVGGTSRMSVRKDGRIFGDADSAISLSGGFLTFFSYGTDTVTFGATAFTLGKAGSYTARLDLANAGGGAVSLTSDAASIFAQRSGTTAQTLRLYRTFTDASNYERLGFIATRTTRFAIAAENAGTGAARSLEISFYTSASDPASTDITDGCFSVWKNSGTGTIKLWANDGGTMKSVALA